MKTSLIWFRMTTHRQWKLFWYYVDDLSMSCEDAEQTIFTAWAYGYIDQQLP